MHELSLVLNILEIADKQAQSHDTDRFESIELEIGTMAGVEMDAFLFAWEAAIKDTVLEDAERIIHHIQAKALCSSCGSRFEIAELYGACPTCGDFQKEILQGKELKIKSLTIQTST